MDLIYISMQTSYLYWEEKEIASMENNTQSLSIESFSYSWLVNIKPSSMESLENSLRHSLDASDEASFIEMDPKMPPSKRFFSNTYDFNFDFPASADSQLALVHADELFSNGYVMPVFVDPTNFEPYKEASDSSLPMLPAESSDQDISRSSFKRCRKMSKRMFLKYLDFLRPLFRRVRGQRTSSQAKGAGGSKVQPIKSTQIHSATSSPRISVAYLVDDWRKSCDSDCSIYEAVLHCKRSIGTSKE